MAPRSSHILKQLKQSSRSKRGIWSLQVNLFKLFKLTLFSRSDNNLHDYAPYGSSCRFSDGLLLSSNQIHQVARIRRSRHNEKMADLLDRLWHLFRRRSLRRHSAFLVPDVLSCQNDLFDLVHVSDWIQWLHCRLPICHSAAFHATRRLASVIVYF